MQALLEQLRSRATPGGLIRLTGMLIVMAGMCSFLLEEWQSWNDMGRYYVVLAGSGLFAAAGFLMSYGLRDNTGARAFLSLALIAVVTGFTTLGGLLHSLVQWDGSQVAAALPAFVQWQAPGPGALLAALLSAYLVQLPIAGFAFKVLARQSARPLTFAFAALNTALLLPFRDSLAVGLLVALSVLFLRFAYTTWLRDALGLKTLEGRAALAALAAPVVIMVARSLWLYQADAMLVWILSGIILFALRAAISLFADNKRRSLLESTTWALLLSVALINSVCALLLLEPLLDLLGSHLSQALSLPLFGWLLAGLLTLLGYRHRAIHGLAAVVLAAMHILGLIFFDHVALTLLAGVTGLACAWVGYQQRYPLVQVSGILVLSAAVLPALAEFVGSVDFSHWLSLTVLGVVAMTAASLWEKRRGGKAVSNAAVQHHHGNTAA